MAYQSRVSWLSEELLSYTSKSIVMIHSTCDLDMHTVCDSMLWFRLVSVLVAYAQLINSVHYSEIVSVGKTMHQPSETAALLGTDGCGQGFSPTLFYFKFSIVSTSSLIFIKSNKHTTKTYVI
jgi:hypothetical protein